MVDVENRREYNYELAERVHSGIKKLRASEKTDETKHIAKHCPFGVSKSTEKNKAEIGTDLNKAFAYDMMAETFIDPAEYHNEVMLKNDMLGYTEAFFSEFPEILKKRSFLPALEALSAQLVDFSSEISESFRSALQEQIKGLLDPAQLAQEMGIEKAIAFGFGLEAKLVEFKSALDGAFQNAVASTIGLFKVLTEKLPKPKEGTDIPDWQSYTEKLKKLMKKNVGLLRNIGRFHFDVQNLFHNLQGIENRQDKQVYDFDESKFQVKDKDGSQAHLTLTDEFISEIVDKANTDPCHVVDNGKTREFEFDKSAEGCPFLELETSQGNFFTNYCQWINKLIERTVLPEIEHHLSK